MPQKKSILALIIILIMAPLAIFVWNESFYWDKVVLLSPIDYPGGLLIRNDSRGDGGFGAKRRGGRKHQGIDMLAAVGTPVRAAKGGRAYVGFHKKGLGLFVEIRHKNEITTIYSHLSKTGIRHTQKVRQGQVIGAVGKTGNAKYNGINPHLHFELRIRGVATDPKRYLSQKSG